MIYPEPNKPQQIIHKGEVPIVDKVYFIPGDLVQLRHAIDNKPKMLVVGTENKIYRDKTSLQGIKCIWFNENKDICEGVFSTKDLEKVS